MMAGKQIEQKIENEANDSALNELIDETVRLYRRLNLVAEEVHHQGEMSGGFRGILRSLNKEGAQTVPQLARARAVTRQHVQIIINRLVKEGHVEFVANPAHKRSPIVRLTPRGKKTIEAMDRREARLLSQSDLGVTDKQMREAARTLRAARRFFESDQWLRLLQKSK